MGRTSGRTCGAVQGVSGEAAEPTVGLSDPYRAWCGKRYVTERSWSVDIPPRVLLPRRVLRHCGITLPSPVDTPPRDSSANSPYRVPKKKPNDGTSTGGCDSSVSHQRASAARRLRRGGSQLRVSNARKVAAAKARSLCERVVGAGRCLRNTNMESTDALPTRGRCPNRTQPNRSPSKRRPGEPSCSSARPRRSRTPGSPCQSGTTRTSRHPDTTLSR